MNHAMQKLAHSARLLGAWFYYSPDAPALGQLNQHLDEGRLANAWPYPAGAPLLVTLSEACRRPQLKDAYQQLFVGPDALAAPPWGSVYLDPEQVLFGESHQALKHFLQQQVGVSLMADRREPLDHIGLLLLLLSQWAQEGQEAHVDRLLGEFLLPWSWRYLEQLEEYSPHSFYCTLARLSIVTLHQWQTERGITPLQPRLYR